MFACGVGNFADCYRHQRVGRLLVAEAYVLLYLQAWRVDAFACHNLSVPFQRDGVVEVPSFHRQHFLIEPLQLGEFLVKVGQVAEVHGDSCHLGDDVDVARVGGVDCRNHFVCLGMAGEEVDERQKLCGLKPLAEMSAYDGHVEEESFVGWDVLAGAVDVVRLVAVKNPHHGLYRLQVDAQAVVAAGVALHVLHVVLLVERAFNLLLADVDEAFALDIEAEAVHFRQDKLVGDEPDGVVGVFHSHDNAAAHGVAPRGTGPEE